MPDQLSDQTGEPGWLLFLFVAVFSLMTVASLVCWALGFKRLARNQPLLPFAGSEMPLGFVHLIAVFALWLLSQVLVASVLLPMFPQPDPTAPPEAMAEFYVRLMSVSSLAQLAITLLAAGFLSVRFRSILAAGIRPRRWLLDLKIGGVAFLMVVPLILGVQWLLTWLVPYEHATLEALAANPTLATVVVSWLAAVLIAPITEEFFFRGVLQGWMQRLGVAEPDQVMFGGWSHGGDCNSANGLESTLTTSNRAPAKASDGNPYRSPEAATAQDRVITDVVATQSEPPYWPILVSAGLFAMVHLGQGPAPIPLFLLGLGLGYVYRQTGSLLPCIVLHFLLNGYSMLWFTLNVFFGEGIPG